MKQTKTHRKSVAHAIRSLRQERRALDAAHNGVLASYNRLYDDFMREKARAQRAEERISLLVGAGVEQDMKTGDVCCHWRVSRFMLKHHRNPELIWDIVADKLRAEMMRYSKTGS